ncbi:MAG: hypothetical protein JKY67_17090 [Pseudomonadales bacterium]|nr:hypothetical protein [Pseudomonadales bacterium]
MANLKYQKRKNTSNSGNKKSLLNGVDIHGASRSRSLAATHCIFTDRRSRIDRRELSQQLPRGFRCRREQKTTLRRMSHALGAEWYLQTSTLDRGASTRR